MPLWKPQSAISVALIIIHLEMNAQIAGQDLTKFNGSFYASGEIFRSNFEVATKEVVSSEEDSSEEDYSETDSSEAKVEIKLKETNIFEEAYDAVERKAALRITLDKEVIVFFEDLNTKHKYVIHTSGNHTTCKSAKKKDWQDNKHPVTVIRGPHKRKYTFLRDILTARKVRVKSRKIEPVRNMYCRVFEMNITDPKQQYIRPVMYWTLNETLNFDNTSNVKVPKTTTTPPPQVTEPRPPPEITDLRSAMKIPRNRTLAVPWMVKYKNDLEPYKTEEMTTRIFNIDYIRQSTVNNLLEIPDGVYCPGNYDKKWPSQPIYSNIKVFHYSARVWNSKTKSTSVIKGWIDVKNRLFRLDYTPWLSKDRGPVTIIAVDTKSNDVGINKTSYDRVYKISSQGSACRAMKIKKLKYDPQMILIPSHISSMTPKTFFTGPVESAKLNYTKVTFKGGVPCHLWSMLRRDWPPGLQYVQSLWQWCFVNKNFFADPIPINSSQMVSLDITIQDLYDRKNKDYEIGQTFSFYFYGVNMTLDKLSETEGFVPKACCKTNNTGQLRLHIKQKTLTPELLRKPDFLYNAWEAVGRVGSIPNPRLRIADFKATQRENDSFLDFELLGTFTDLGGKSKENTEVKIEDIMNRLVDNAKNNKFNFTYDQQNYTIDNVCFT
uniref:LolA-like domain-containing protein n=1 Tax=Ixodes ricinus TaxID=34613 RepID=A0A6B0VDH8_IXORI